MTNTHLAPWRHRRVCIGGCLGSYSFTCQLIPSLPPPEKKMNSKKERAEFKGKPEIIISLRTTLIPRFSDSCISKRRASRLFLHPRIFVSCRFLIRPVQPLQTPHRRWVTHTAPSGNVIKVCYRINRLTRASGKQAASF